MDWSCAKVITHVAVCVYVNVYRCCGSELVGGLSVGTVGFCFYTDVCRR